MSLRASFNLFRKVQSKIKTPINGQQIQQVRHSGGQFSYRCGGYPAPRAKENVATIMMSFMWWWILYHLMTEPEMLYGEYPYPDPAKWTNEELGIPSL